MNLFKRIYFSLPFILFLLILIVLWRGLALHPGEISSPLINHALPDFQLPNLFDTKTSVTNKNLLGHVTLLNVWATWCNACVEEHHYLLHLAKNNKIIIYGLNYKDNLITAKQWLMENGNPYQTILVDKSGNTAIDWGVYGTPETFIIDKKGIIRYKQIGPITKEIWATTLNPLIDKLENESL